MIINEIENYLNLILIDINDNNYDQTYNLFRDIKKDLTQDLDHIFGSSNDEKITLKKIEAILKIYWNQMTNDV